MGRSLLHVVAVGLLLTGTACSQQTDGAQGNPEAGSETSTPVAINEPVETTAQQETEVEAPASDPIAAPAAEEPVVSPNVATPIAPAAAAATQTAAPTPSPIVAPTSQPNGDVSIHSGVYTAAQAARGQQVSQRECASCHSPTEWNRIVQSWNGRSAYDLVSHLRNVMPLDGPGRLPWQSYTDLVAYMLQLNQVPTGQQELPTDEARLQAIKIDRR
jgi:S-disulfanyl-L-cysteine oxidoreductase SoxD